MLYSLIVNATACCILRVQKISRVLQGANDSRHEGAVYCTKLCYIMETTYYPLSLSLSLTHTHTHAHTNTHTHTHRMLLQMAEAAGHTVKATPSLYTLSPIVLLPDPVKNVASYVNAGGMYKPCEPTANFIHIGPRYLGVVSGDIVVPDNELQ